MAEPVDPTSVSKSGGGLAAAESPNTRRTYDAAWRRFDTWCVEREYVALPAEPLTLARYFAEAGHERDGDRPRYKGATFGVWLAAIGDRHVREGYAHPGSDPVVTRTLRELRRDRVRDGETVRRAAPLLAHDLQAIVTTVADQARGWREHVAARRDIALLVVGFSGALRREELASLEIRDITRAGDRDGDWLRVHLRRADSRSDAAESVYLPRGKNSGRWCPWCAVLRWMAVIAAYDSAVDFEMRAADKRRRAGAVLDSSVVAGVAADSGSRAVIRLFRTADVRDAEHLCDRPWPGVPHAAVPLFRSLRNGLPHEKRCLTGRSVSRVLHRRAVQAGLDPAMVDLLSAHALRAGAATEAFDRGASLDEVMNLTRHASVASVRRYDRNSRFSDIAATSLGL